jgi:hypothetical protein
MSLELLGHVDLPGNLQPGGFDHAAVHRGSDRLYVVHTANDALSRRNIRTLRRREAAYSFALPDFLALRSSSQTV